MLKLNSFGEGPLMNLGITWLGEGLFVDPGILVVWT
jgi:hypothetical protein